MTNKENGASEKVQKVSRGGRGVSYPALSLEEAVKRARQLWEHEKKNAAPIEAIASHWGYSPSSSGVRTAIAALISYGLLVDKGAGDSRQVQLTERALDIILDVPEKAKALVDAVKSPKIYSELFGLWSPENLPSDHTIKSHLLRNKNFNHKAVDGFIKDFRDSVSFSGIKNSDKLPALDANEMLDELMRQPESSPSNQVIAPTRGVLAFGAAAPMLAVTSSEVGTYPVAKNCTIRLLATGPVTRKSIEALVKQLELNIELDVFPDEMVMEQASKQ